MHEGDRVFFRNAAERTIVGYGLVGGVRRGPHSHDPKTPAIVVDVVDPVRFDSGISDVDFRRVFEKHGGNKPEFPLFDLNGNYARKTYAYPLKREIAKDLMALGAGKMKGRKR